MKIIETVFVTDEDGKKRPVELVTSNPDKDLVRFEPEGYDPWDIPLDDLRNLVNSWSSKLVR